MDEYDSDSDEVVTIETTDDESPDETETKRKSSNLQQADCLSREPYIWCPRGWRDKRKKWAPHIAALEKAIGRENLLKEATNDYRRKFSNKGLRSLIEHIRYKIKEEEKEEPDIEQQIRESGHDHPYIRQVLEQELSDDPPQCSYVYYSATDNWGTEASSPEDVVRGIFRKINR